MRGSPPLHLVLFAVGFALLAIPLARLTFARPATPAVVSTREASPGDTATPTLLRVRFAHPPRSASLKHEAAELLPAPSPEPRAPSFEARTRLTLPPDGIELLLEVTWPQGTPDTAVTVELEPDGLEARSQTRWSSGGMLTEVLTFHWKP